jgi:hypothetical protein
MSVLISFSVQANNICQNDNLQRIKQEKGTYSSINELFKITKSQSSLHIVGEAHFNTSVQLLEKIIDSFVSTYPKENRVCLFLEIPEGGVNLFEGLFNRALAKATTNKQKDQIKSMREYYPSIINKAKSFSMDIFEVDHPGHLDGDMSEDERNDYMAIKISELMEHSCDEAIMFVGKAHISPLEDRASLVQNIKKFGQSLVTYNVAAHEEAADPRFLSSIVPLCSADKESLPVAFPNTILLPSTNLYPIIVTERRPFWNDFDYSILK